MAEKIVGGLYRQFATDPDLERDGIELFYKTGDRDEHGNDVDIALRIARAGGGNTKYQKILDHHSKPYRRQIQTESIDPKQLDAIMREVYADSILLGWDTVTTDKDGAEIKRVPTVPDANGESMSFERKNVIKLFTNLPDLFADVQQSAQKVALFRKDLLEAAAKNL